LRALQDEGLELVTNHGNFRVRIHATAEADEIGPVDLLLFCVKSHDTDQAAQLAEPMVVEETVVLSLQNGIDNVDKLSTHFGREKVMGGTAYIESTIASPGVIAHTGNPGRLVFGELNGERTARAEAVLDVFLKAGIDAELTTRIHEVLWSKFLFICGVHGVSTLSRSTLGLVLASPETRALLEDVMREVETLARKRGIALEDDVVRQSMELAQSYNKRFKCSMLRDLEWHRPMEIEALNGMVVRLGKEAGIQTPLNQVIYACLKLENKKIINPVWASQLTD
jgi:2-dehydropantoate 2-reductase